MYCSDIYNLWNDIKNGCENNLKRYIKIQFKRLGLNTFNDITAAVESDKDYNNILFVIIAYYTMNPISCKI